MLFSDKGRPAPPGSDAVHVVFAFGSEYIVPAFVAVNSTLQNSAPAKRARLVLHLLVEEAIAQVRCYCLAGSCFFWRYPWPFLFIFC
jgi:hypothetical protein